MSILTKAFHKIAIIFSPIVLSMMIISCSGDDEVDKNIYDHRHDESVDMKKHLFEHEFAEQCIATEIAKLNNKQGGRERYAESCLCIATYLFKDLAAKQSYTLLNDKKHAQSLRNKYEEAVKHCL